MPTFHSASPRHWLRCPSRTPLKSYCHLLQTMHFGEMTSPSCPLRRGWTRISSWGRLPKGLLTLRFEKQKVTNWGKKERWKGNTEWMEWVINRFGGLLKQAASPIIGGEGQGVCSGCCIPSPRKSISIERRSIFSLLSPPLPAQIKTVASDTFITFLD